MSIELIISYSLIVTLGAMLPGPNGLLIVTNSVTYGRKTALVTLLGTLTAFYAHGLFSLIGVSALIYSSSKAFFILKLIGVAYLGYLGITLLLQAFQKDNKNMKMHKKSYIHNQTYRKVWSQGFLTNLLNPKVSIFYLALFPQFLTEASNIVTTTALLVTIQVIIVALWFTSVAFVAAKISSNGSPRFFKIVKGAAGSIMLWFGLNLAQTQLRT